MSTHLKKSLCSKGSKIYAVLSNCSSSVSYWFIRNIIVFIHCFLKNDCLKIFFFCILMPLNQFFPCSGALWTTQQLQTWTQDGGIARTCVRTLSKIQTVSQEYCQNRKYSFAPQNADYLKETPSASVTMVWIWKCNNSKGKNAPTSKMTRGRWVLTNKQPQQTNNSKGKSAPIPTYERKAGSRKQIIDGPKEVS